MPTETPNEGAYREGMPPFRPAGPKPAGRSVMRYAISLLVLVAVVGGLAWVTQYLPGWRPAKKADPPPSNDKLLAFVREIARWTNREDPEGNPEEKDYSPGDKGHYDFLFENTSGHEVLLLYYLTSCECAGVKVAAVPASDWDRLKGEHEAKPGEPLAYAKEPDWASLPSKQTEEPALRVGPGVKGVVRVEWQAKSNIGARIPLKPFIYFKRPDDPGRVYYQTLAVPARIMPLLQLSTSRVEISPLAADRTVSAKFMVWSSTRDKLDVDLVPDPPEPFFEFKKEELSPQVCAAREEEMRQKKQPTLVKCAYDITIFVHESKAGKQLDQGTYYRRWAFKIDGKANPDAPIYGPEFVGRVDGIVRIGGGDTQGRVVFKSFSARQGDRKQVQLAADPKVELKTVDGHPDQPPYVKVTLTRDETNKGNWLLDVEVPPGATTPGQFTDANAVVLSIVGTKRLVRIPLEGNIVK